MIKEKLYYPVDAKIEYNDNEDYDGDYWRDDISPSEAAEYFENVEYALLKENKTLDESGLMEYFHSDNEALGTAIKGKVVSAVPSIELVGDELFGVTELKVKEPLTQAEVEEFKDYLLGQLSDGWGEGVEQREIKTPDGELYISFWSSDKGYFIDNETEFENRMGIAEQDMSDGPKLEM